MNPVIYSSPYYPQVQQQWHAPAAQALTPEEVQSFDSWLIMVGGAILALQGSSLLSATGSTLAAEAISAMARQRSGTPVFSRANMTQSAVNVSAAAIGWWMGQFAQFIAQE